MKKTSARGKKTERRMKERAKQEEWRVGATLNPFIKIIHPRRKQPDP